MRRGSVCPAGRRRRFLKCIITQLKNMNKSILKVATTAFAVAAIVASCSNKEQKHSDSDSAAALDEITSMVSTVLSTDELIPYKPAFFNNPELKVAATAAGDSTYTETASGLKYAIIKQGTGARPAATDVVTVNYCGVLTDEDLTKFDSSYDRPEPTSVPLNRGIAGWTEGLQLMPVGSIYEFYIPSDLAYGEQGAPGAIPPNAPLIFRVELLGIQDAGQQ